MHEGGHGEQDKRPQTRFGAKSFSSLRGFARPLRESGTRVKSRSFGLSVHVRRKGVGMRSSRELGAIPSSVICSTAGFGTLFSLPKPLFTAAAEQPQAKSGSGSMFAVVASGWGKMFISQISLRCADLFF